MTTTARSSPSTTPSTRSWSTRCPALHRGDRDQGQAAQRRATSSWPTRSSRRATPRRPTSSSPRTRPAMTLVDSDGPVRAARRRRRWPRSRRSIVPERRQLDRLRRPLDRARLQPDAVPRGRAARRRSWTWPSPEWKGQVGISPTGADFQAIVSAVLALEGEERDRRRGSTGLEDQRQGLRRQQRGVMKAVNAGEVDDRDHLPLLLVPGPGRVRRRTATTSQLHFFGNQDPGAFVSVSGAGVLKSSEHAGGRAAARRRT